MILKSDGTVWESGINYFGELGNGGKADSGKYIKVAGLPSGIVAIAGGSDWSMALASDHTVWAWGYNGEGELGDGTTTHRTAPVQVVGLADVISIAAAYYCSMALKSDGTVWTWGYNGDGELGNNSSSDSSVPVQVQTTGGLPLTGITSIAAGYTHGLAVATDGTVWAWGTNTYGEIGTGIDVGPGKFSNVAVQVPDVTNAVTVAGGDNFSFALEADGTVMAWEIIVRAI